MADAHPPSERRVIALFVRRDSIYKTIPGVDAWDEDRDARKWPGGYPCVAHPPCRGWGRMRQWSYADEVEKNLAIRAILCVQLWGGVVEHPAESSLWPELALPRPGQAPRRGGYTIEVADHSG